MKKAFTLAEVLITLGIIGIVASMTLPGLVQNYQKKQFATMAKTNYVILNNALERAKSEYGTDVNNWIYSSSTRNEQAVDFVQRYLLPYLNVTKFCKKVERGQVSDSLSCSFQGNTLFPETDGVMFILSNSAKVYVYVADGVGGSNITRIGIVYDVNGFKQPNRYGRDIFIVELGGGGFTNIKKDRNVFLPYLYDKNKTCDEYTSHANDVAAKHACTQTGGRSACLAYLMCNGWNVPKDYPW